MAGDARVRALAGSAEVHRALADPQTGVYIVDQDGRILWASDSMRVATGYAPQDLVGHSGWSMLVPPEDVDEVARFKAHLTQGDGIIWMRLVTPAGGRAWSRVDTWVRQDLIVCAFRPEDDPREQHLHFRMHPRDP